MGQQDVTFLGGMPQLRTRHYSAPMSNLQCGTTSQTAPPFCQMDPNLGVMVMQAPASTFQQQFVGALPYQIKVQ